MKCRHCQSELRLPLVDLGTSPPSNAYLTPDALHGPEAWYPLRVLVCETCWLVQTEDFLRPEDHFGGDYAYFSSFSTTWLAHAEAYVAAMVERFGLGPESHVVEVAANDGYLLQYVKQRGIPCLGIEPTHSTAEAARAKGIQMREAFFGRALADSLVAEGRQADLTAANNVLAHVPDIGDFVGGFTRLLAPSGVATFEFPHLLNLVVEGQFDTIYHEHYSYLSLAAVQAVFAANGLRVFDVEEIPTHGGSLRVFAQRADTGRHTTTDVVAALLAREADAGLTNARGYARFQADAERVKDDAVRFLLDKKREGKRVAAYGAAAKGNTLLNYAGIRGDLISFVVDRNPAKQGRFLPGSRIPIVDEAALRASRPDVIVVLPWNLKREVAEQLSYAREWGAEFVTLLPRLEVLA